MSSQHSPAPWTIRDDHPEHCTFEIRTTLDGRYHDSVATVYRHTNRDDPRYLADARLIAASPDLLEQLRKVRDWMDDPVLNMRCPFDIPLASDIREAVAKAEPKS